MRLLVVLTMAVLSGSLMAQERGYYRMPAVHGATIVFAAEGDLWRVDAGGGAATRITTHPGNEQYPAISPDGAWLAFTASYEGPGDVYVMPMTGGLPRRLTWEGAAFVNGWTPDGRVVYRTRAFSTLPNFQLVTVDPASGARTVLPLAQAAEGTWDRANGTLWFTRFSQQGSRNKRYRGGTAQSIWRYAGGTAEAQDLRGDFAGTDKAPMFWNGRVYFLSDRDDHMNLWSMAPDGSDKQQHTRHVGWDVRDPSLGQGRIVYQLGADLRMYDIASGTDREVPITLVSDNDQTRERWITNPMSYLDGWALSHDGTRVALTARGRVFVAPVKAGRLVEATRHSGVRYRTAWFLAGDTSLAVLSDESGEVEWWSVPSDGMGDARQITRDGRVVRMFGTGSPDGRWIAHVNHDQQLWITEVATGQSRQIAFSAQWGFPSLSWSPDSRWLAYAMPGPNDLSRIFLYEVASHRSTAVTTDRYISWNPAWSPDGRWMYFLTDRTFRSTVNAPWGTYQPEPHFQDQTSIFAFALTPGTRSPFQPADELAGRPDTAQVRPVTVTLEGTSERVIELPIPAGDYANLRVSGRRLFYTEREGNTAALKARDINAEGNPITIVSGINAYELSGDGSKLAIRRGTQLYVINATSGANTNLNDDVRVNLEGWTFALNPREDWRQLFLDSWRLERDYFYDPNMHGVDWVAMRDKYLPLVDRVRTRDDLSDLQAQLASELATLHTYIFGGDHRSGPENVGLATLGAQLARDESQGGWRITHIYRADPDEPSQLSPLARYGVDARVGDVIRRINGVSTLTVPHPHALLRNQAGRQVRLSLARGRATHDVIVQPITTGRDFDLRYDEWEYTRRLAVDSASDRTMGYVHLRAMGAGNIEEWFRHFYPAVNRQGMIIDVRHNGGGNIESWFLARLLREAWMYWQPRVGNPYWNMQYAFRGHVVVLVDEWTASDGEVFAEGFRRLGIGAVVGTRTWGGEIWLTSSNTLNDRGVVTAAEFGVYADGEWLIENHGVDPDVVVDNLPRATFEGRDAQLEAAIAHLRQLMRDDPRPVPPPPPYPDKSTPDNRRRN